MGSGLTSAYNIVQKHHGEIRVNSEPGKGTTVVITLPTSSVAGSRLPQNAKPVSDGRA